MTTHFKRLFLTLSLIIGLGTACVEQAYASGCCSGSDGISCKVKPPKIKKEAPVTQVCSLEVKKDLSIGKDLEVSGNAWVQGNLDAKELSLKCGKNKFSPVVACEKCLKDTRGTIGFTGSSTELSGVIVRGKGFIVKELITIPEFLITIVPVCYEKPCACDDASTVVCTVEGPDNPATRREVGDLTCFVTNAQGNPNGFDLVIFGLDTISVSPDQIRLNFIAQCPGC